MERKLLPVEPDVRFMHNWHIEKDCRRTRSLSTGRDQTAHHLRAAPIAQVSRGIRGFPRLASGPQSERTDHLRFLRTRFVEQVGARLSFADAVRLVSQTIPTRLSSQRQAVPEFMTMPKAFAWQLQWEAC